MRGIPAPRAEKVPSHGTAAGVGSLLSWKRLCSTDSGAQGSRNRVRAVTRGQGHWPLGNRGLAGQGQAARHRYQDKKQQVGSCFLNM